MSVRAKSKAAEIEADLKTLALHWPHAARRLRSYIEVSEKRDDDAHKRGFAVGIAVACGTMVSVWGEEVAPLEIMGGAGLTTRAKMKALGVDAYDLDNLKPIFKIFRAKTEARKHGVSTAKGEQT